MDEETRAILRELTERLVNLRAVFAPIIPDSLANLEGWTWSAEVLPSRRILNRGDEVDILPVIQRMKSSEKGWINQLVVIFSDPDTEMLFTTDNWTIQTTPRLANMVGAVTPTNATVYNLVYNPATPLGPLYGLAWSASQFWPYKTQIVFRARHPRTALTATSQIVTAILGRHYISDEKLFYESIFLESQRQTIGKVQVPIRRPV